MNWVICRYFVLIAIHRLIIGVGRYPCKLDVSWYNGVHMEIIVLALTFLTIANSILVSIAIFISIANRHAIEEQMDLIVDMSRILDM